MQHTWAKALLVKLTGSQLAGFLRAPDPRWATILLYGPDAGLVAERAAALMRAAAESLDDPFRTATLTGAGLAADPARLLDETLAMSLMGGRRAVRVRDADDKLAGPLKSFLEERRGDTLVIFEAGDLPARSALRKLIEGADQAAAIACYTDGPRELPGIIRETLREHGVSIAGDAVDYLAGRLGGDRLLTRRELEKLALYVGAGGTAGIEDALASVGDSSALSLEDLIYAVFDGQAAPAERALVRLMTEGEQPVRILRAAARHAMRLELAVADLVRGRSAEEIVRGQRPAIFFKYADRFGRQLRRWSPRLTAAAITRLTHAEFDAKRTILPGETICREALTAITTQQF